MAYKDFLAERARIIDARQRVQRRSEQLVTGGATGALVLSITFLEKIAPNPPESSTPWLIVAWVLLLFALLCVLFASFKSASAFEHALDQLDRSYRDDRPYDHVGPAYKMTNFASAMSAICFVSGVASLAVFAFLNAPSNPIVQ